ncbi:sigma-54 interaction domain-containing protein [Bacteroidota bacterium]
MKKKLKQQISQFNDFTEEQFEALYKITETLNRSEHHESLVENALDIVIDIVDAERGLFAKYNSEEKNFKIITARNIEKKSIEDLSEFSSGVLNQLVKNKKPMLYHDAQSDPKLSQYESVQLQNIKSVIGVPIMRDKTIWGAIIADSQTNRKDFSRENLQFLSFFSNLVSLSLDKIIAIEKLEDEKQILLSRVQPADEIPDMVGKSKPMRSLAKTIHKVADTEATVLIQGESGTGKELVANAIHKLSKRRNGTFLAQFCGSIPDNLLTSELFGYKKGAFTGAVKDKKGLLEIASGGTFFLDEIADITPSLQAKLLRVIENKEITRLGDTSVHNVDVRIIAATNKDLSALVEEGKFREDLFYRLNVFPITLPTLKDRIEDIPLLAEHFIKMNNKKANITPGAIKKLKSYNWPGNVRHLFNVLERALIICDSNIITEAEIMIEHQKGDSDPGGTLENIERDLLMNRLNKFDGNKTLAAKSLGVSVRWVQLKLKDMDK